jgi:hypothetical protein
MGADLELGFRRYDAIEVYTVILPRIKICEKDEWRFSRNRVILVVSE